MMMQDHDPLCSPVQFARHVGPQRAELFSRLGVVTIEDLLLLMPRDVLDLTHVSAVFELSDDRVHTVRGEVVDRDSRVITGGRTMTGVLLKSDGGFVRGVWFNQPYMLGKFEPGQTVLFSAQPKWREKRWEFTHPRVQYLEADDRDTTPGIVPRYPLTDGLSMAEVRRATHAAVEDYAHLLPDVLPADFRASLSLLSLAESARGLHSATTLEEHLAARHRLLFGDLLEFQLGVALRRRFWRKDSTAKPLECTAKIDARIRRLYPFTLTAGQNQAINEIVTDLGATQAMHRLLQADVGAGKTAVAVYALLVAVANGCQGALMAPTELLAVQHWQLIDRLLENSRVTRCLLTGQPASSSERASRLADISSGRMQLVIGTQALIQKDVRFRHLAVAVIDEQHKFGVGQRSRFQSGEMSPHLLVMTATPIPRSLCLTMFGDLDLSVIRDLPPGRQKIVTSRVEDAVATGKMWQFIRKKLSEGRQAYVVCPRVETDTDLTHDDGSVESVGRSLSEGELQGWTLAAVHGRQARPERQAIMDQFRHGEIQVLVATSVVEVGVDVPNATLMVIQQADRFGLSQLHQLRGRIGRGAYQGYCFLCSSRDDAEASRRLEALQSTSDGFTLAEVDFELRGPGDILGTRQHGTLPLRRAVLPRDQTILEDARRAAFELVTTGLLDTPEFAALKRQVLDRFQKLMELPQTG